MEKSHIKQLLEDYLSGNISDPDRRLLEELVIANRDPLTVTAALRTLLEATGGHPSQVPAGWEGIPYAITALEKNMAIPVRRISRRWWIAASALVVIGIGAYLWTSDKNMVNPASIAVKTVDIAPGKEGAILTLSDGSQLVLDSINNGIIATQNGTAIKLENGRLTYDAAGEITSEVVYNTMSTPRGRQFSLLLPDGTKVWLNAASSIRYPTVFSGKERRVDVTGEVYFEVAKKALMPFVVNVNDCAKLEVLGTHFNVNGYQNENSIKTTLIEGSVKVNGTIIKPGQQAQVRNTIHRSGQAEVQGGSDTKMQLETTVLNADIETVVAWKNGYIYFDGAGLDEIMGQLERWYDIEVVYENNKIPVKQLAGGMTRGVSLNDLLKYLEKMGVRCKLVGRTLVVLS